MYFWLVWLLALFVILVALIVANTRAVELDWLVGSSRSSLVWIILVSALIGWVLGLVTSVVFRHQTRRRAPAA